MRIALGLQYDGSSYSGWQSQLSLNTVQDKLEAAITRFVGDNSTDELVRVITAGRTDTGVHALGQVVHFDVNVEREDWSWVRGINSFLPESIVVDWAKPVSEEFSARFSAYERTYIYAMHAGPCRSPMAAARAGYLMTPADKWFDVPAMEAAAQCLIGEHDFSSFRSSECQAKSPIKTLYSIEIISAQPWLYFKIRGNAFCTIWSEISLALF
jgi:tRNA pseudouridine38-40 synthase